MFLTSFIFICLYADDTHVFSQITVWPKVRQVNFSGGVFLYLIRGYKREGVIVEQIVKPIEGFTILTFDDVNFR